MRLDNWTVSFVHLMGLRPGIRSARTLPRHSGKLRPRLPESESTLALTVNEARTGSRLRGRLQNRFILLAQLGVLALTESSHTEAVPLVR